MEALRDIDQIAYIRFASVYKSFADLDDMREEMQKLVKSPVEVPGGRALPDSTRQEAG
jgi:transcriptional regulator NrdR family protein